ncbi:MAG: RagB/SusD family nutrient uptake outer membrane protein [Muribaculaceae bacterium]|nr:RagB/SusD family nutrient uptake outer membrane protein [Muribaculaceae bacterium]
MKHTLKIFAACAFGSVLASTTLTSCNDLDTQPDNYYVTSQEKEDAIASRPELAKAGVVGISSTYNQYMAVYSTAHCDFGWPGAMMMIESSGIDMVAPNTGYNWFASAGAYNFGNNNNYANNLSWYYAYKVINSANTVLSTIDADTTDPELQLYAAQAYANRAYIYFTLAQLFQYTYVGHESLPCVPILTEENSDEAAVNGAPRATVQAVYDRIMADLDKAIQLLTDSGLDVTRIADTGTTRFVSLGTAYGLRARVNLVMNKWQAAADDAANAIAKSSCTPYSIAEASQPAFNSASDHNLMWCVFIQENDRVVTSGIVNWASHMGSLNYGYASVGGWRMINKALFNTIPDTDCRKGWWLDGNRESANLSAAQKEQAMAYGAPAYTQMKFAPYQNVLATTTNATSFILMRIEEMYLIQAEATAMAGGDGKSILENFVKTYRDPSYTCPASSGQAFQDEVWRQRRIELWGECLSYFDLLRLNKPLDRRGGGWDVDWVYNVPAPLKPLLIPNGEVQANNALGANNDTWSKPNAVSDY